MPPMTESPAMVQFQQCCFSRVGSERAVTKLGTATPSKRGDKIAAVVMTICGGSSYDDLFREIPLQSDEGTTVKAYSITAGEGVEKVLLALSGEPITADDPCVEELRDLMAAISAVDAPDCVVINFECCSHYSDLGFGDKASMQLILRAVSQGYMVMCSDFSLKALIGSWGDSKGELGPCPFVKTDEFGGEARLRFESEKLVACERSAQLQKVGELCDKGEVQVCCMGGTIGFGVDPKADTPAYKLEVLTVIDPANGNAPACPEELRCSTGGVTGPAGHVMLTYSTGGIILASAGHWVELLSFDVKEDRMLSVAEQAYGDSYTSQIRSELESCQSYTERAKVSACWSRKMVQQSAPCKMYSPRPPPSKKSTSGKKYY